MFGLDCPLFRLDGSMFGLDGPLFRLDGALFRLIRRCIVSIRCWETLATSGSIGSKMIHSRFSIDDEVTFLHTILIVHLGSNDQC